MPQLQDGQRDKGSVAVRKFAKFVYRSREELQKNNPSIKDGLTPDKERRWRRQYVRLITEAGIQLRV